MKRKIGFTSTELLAVIIIVGIFSLIAIFGGSYFLNQSKKESVTKDAKNIIQSTSALAKSLGIVETSCISLDYLSKSDFYNGDTKNMKGSILVDINTDGTYRYKLWLLVDQFGMNQYAVPNSLEFDVKKVENLSEISQVCQNETTKIYE